MSSNAVREYYDHYWATEGWETGPGAELTALLERHVGGSDRCLEVGCGDGGTSGVWAEAHAASYTGVDIADSALAIAADRGLRVLRIGDASVLPFEAGSFDVALCIEVLEHLFEPQRALAEMHRVLAPRGRVVVTVPNLAHWRTRIDVGILGRWNPRGDALSSAEPWRDPHLRFFTLRALRDLLTRSGFECLESGGTAAYGLAQHVPGLRSFSRSPAAGLVARRLAAVAPGAMAAHLYAVAVRT